MAKELLQSPFFKDYLAQPSAHIFVVSACRIKGEQAVRLNFVALACRNKMESKACEEEKPQQPVGCEDFDDEHNALSA